MYTTEEKERAYREWVRLGSFRLAGEEMGISEVTMRRLGKKGRWEDRRRNGDYGGGVRIQELEGVGVRGILGRGYEGLGEREVGDLEKAAILEEVCLACLEGRRSVVSGRDCGYWPQDFKDILNGLRVAWDSRERIIRRGSSSVQVGGDMNVQVNLVDMLRRAVSE